MMAASLRLLAPQLCLAGGVLGALAAGMLPRLSPRLLRALGLAALLGAMAALLALDLGAAPPLLRLDGLGFALQFLFCAGALPLVLFLSGGDEVPLALTLGSVLGMGLLAVSDNAVMLFLGLEFMSLPAYLLVARSRSRGALEAAVKYFFAGGVAGALFLMGMALRYAASGSLALAPVAGPLADAGLALMGAAALFKLGAVPLHFWLPDVYEASSPELAGFFSTAMKAAATLLLFRLAGLGPASPFAAALPWIGGLTALAGALLALRQERLQRLLSYSSISHAGNLILGVGAWAAAGRSTAAATAVVFYLAAYLFMSAGAFAWLKVSGLCTRAELRGCAARRPLLAGLFAALLLALAGIPPTGGFLAKLLVFWEAVKAGLYGPLLLAGLGALLSLGYYLGLVRDMYFEAPTTPHAFGERRPGTWLVGTCAAAAVLLGLAPGLIGSLPR